MGHERVRRKNNTSGVMIFLGHNFEHHAMFLVAILQSIILESSCKVCLPLNSGTKLPAGDRLPLDCLGPKS